tara:strand:- start:277 stop:666 length:390 start_codon:yes stop_codon:yes gene_type:complete
MSTLTISNLNDGTTTVPTTFVTNGSIKAWSNINQTGTQAIRDSLNTSSLVDDSTGYTRINYTSGFNNTNYCHFGASSGTGGSNGDHGFIPHNSANGNTTSQSHQLRSANHGGTRTDNEFTFHGTMGDLA